MPLMELDPPSTRPWSQVSSRFSISGTGSALNPQLNLGWFAAAKPKPGSRSSGLRLDPPASSSTTETSGSSDSRAATTEPAAPDPTTR